MLPLQQNKQEDKSTLRRFAEAQAKREGRKVAKKLAKKGVKVAAKIAKVFAKKFVMALSKLIAWFLGTIGLPVIGFALCAIIALVLISLAWSYLFGTGEGLTGEDKKIHEYIVARANSTVNMSSSIERPYRVPEKLIAATIQLEAFSKNDDIRSIIHKMSSSLAPVFDYGQYDEWKEKQVTVCEDGDCKTGEVIHTENLVSKLDSVEYWNGSTTFKYTPHVSDWVTTTEITYKTIQVPVQKVAINEEEVKTTKVVCEQVFVPGEDKIIKIGEDLYRIIPGVGTYKEVCKPVTTTSTIVKKEFVTVMEDKQIEVKTITKTRHQYFTSQETTTSDYSKFDSILNSYSLGLNDKKLMEANYLFMGGTIAYTEWLQTMGGGMIYGGGYFDGNIIPGSGVPAQFMPFYRSAEKQYGVDWYVLAALHFVETGFSTHPTMISSAGAVGHMQFMPATWAGWKYNIGGGLVSSSTDITSVPVIASGNGYGRDANGDGKADPWNVEDAIHTAAYYLAKNGYASDPRSAIFQYNHADWYVNKVLYNAERFKNEAIYEGGGGGETPQLQPGSFMRPALGPVSSPFGSRWGKMHYGLDIASGGKSQVPIVAAADGVVHRSYLSSSYGNVVFIKHNINGKIYETVYAHMTMRAVSEGATVKQGQFLGYMGSTGDSTGVHLHFEVHSPEWNSAKSGAVNPALLVQF